MTYAAKVEGAYWVLLGLLIVLVAYLVALTAYRLYRWALERRWRASARELRRTMIEGSRASRVATERREWSEGVEAARRLRLERGVPDVMVEIAEGLEEAGELVWITEASA